MTSARTAPLVPNERPGKSTHTPSPYSFIPRCFLSLTEVDSGDTETSGVAIDVAISDAAE